VCSWSGGQGSRTTNLCGGIHSIVSPRYAITSVRSVGYVLLTWREDIYLAIGMPLLSKEFLHTFENRVLGWVVWVIFRRNF